MRALIKCPKCEREGITSILGELKPTGHLIIQRIYQYQSGKFHKKYTIIGGKDFFVVCDQCGETVYFKQINKFDPNGLERRENAVLNYWQLGVYRSGTLQGTNQAGAFGSAFA